MPILLFSLMRAVTPCLRPHRQIKTPTTTTPMSRVAGRVPVAKRRCGRMRRRLCRWQCRAGSAVVSGASRTSRRRLGAFTTTVARLVASVRPRAPVPKRRRAWYTAVCRASRPRELVTEGIATEGRPSRRHVGLSGHGRRGHRVTTQEFAPTSLATWTSRTTRRGWTRSTA